MPADKRGETVTIQDRSASPQAAGCRVWPAARLSSERTAVSSEIRLVHKEVASLEVPAGVLCVQADLGGGGAGPQANMMPPAIGFSSARLGRCGRGDRLWGGTSVCRWGAVPQAKAGNYRTCIAGNPWVDGACSSIVQPEVTHPDPCVRKGSIDGTCEERYDLMGICPTS